MVPRAPRLEVVGEKLKVSWEPVHHTPPVTHYCVILDVNGTEKFFDYASKSLQLDQNCSTAIPAGTSSVLIACMTGASSKEKYKAQICAGNVVGWSDYSMFSGIVPLSEPMVPGAPRL